MFKLFCFMTWGETVVFSGRYLHHLQTGLSRCILYMREKLTMNSNHRTIQIQIRSYVHGLFPAIERYARAVHFKSEKIKDNGIVYQIVCQALKGFSRF